MFDLFEAHEAGLVGDAAGGVEAAVGVAFAELEQPQAGAVGLLGVGPAFELVADPGVARRGRVGQPSVGGARGTIAAAPGGVRACGPGWW